MTLIAFIVVLGVLVIVHEWGHFQMARWCGVRVETFSIGFGPQLYATERGGTVYRVAAIPLGGYVKMAGDEPDSEERNAPDAFYSQPLYKRAAIVLAGPVMNLILAFALAPLIYLVGVPEPVYLDEPATIGWVTEAAPATVFEPGDRILAIDGRPIQTWRDLQAQLALASGEAHVLIDRGGVQVEQTLTIDKTGAMAGWFLPPMPPVIEQVIGGSAAEAAGLQPGDLLVSIGGQSISHWMQISQLLAEIGEQPVPITIQRDGQQIELTITPRKGDDGRVLLGIARREESRVHRYPAAEAVGRGFGRVAELTGLTFQVLERLFTGRLGLEALGGPLMIAQGAGDAARQGAGALLTFMIFISIQLGILNLLPIPVLDGGHLLLMAIEAGIRRPLPEKLVVAVQYTGFAFLLGLILYVTRNDIMRMWGDKIGKLLGGS